MTEIIHEVIAAVKDDYQRPFLALLTGHDHALIDVVDKETGATISQDSCKSAFLGEV